MAFAKPILNAKQIFKLALVGVGAVLCFTPEVKAAQITTGASGVDQQSASATLTKQQPKLLAAASNACLYDIAEGFSVETRNYYVGICYTNNGTYYVGHSKNGNANILLRAYSPRRNVYVAKNNLHTYTLDLNRNQLIIKLPNGKRSVERVIRVIDS